MADHVKNLRINDKPATRAQSQKVMEQFRRDIPAFERAYAQSRRGAARAYRPGAVKRSLRKARRG